MCEDGNCDGGADVRLFSKKLASKMGRATAKCIADMRKIAKQPGSTSESIAEAMRAWWDKFVRSMSEAEHVELLTGLAMGKTVKTVRDSHAKQAVSQVLSRLHSMIGETLGAHIGAPSPFGGNGSGPVAVKAPGVKPPKVSGRRKTLVK